MVSRKRENCKNCGFLLSRETIKGRMHNWGSWKLIEFLFRTKNKRNLKKSCKVFDTLWHQKSKCFVRVNRIISSSRGACSFPILKPRVSH
jgi:hypothetical protein